MKTRSVSLDSLLTRIRRPVEIEPEGHYSELGVYCFGRGLFHKPSRSGLEVGDKHLFVVHEGDFILQTTFAWEGAVAVASAQDHGMYGSIRVLTFQTDASRCNPKFLQLFFRTREGMEQLRNISPGSAGRNRVLNVKKLQEVKVPLPPRERQDRLVDVIEALTIRLDATQRLRAQIQKDAKALLHSVLHRVIQGAPYRPLGEVAPIIRRPVAINAEGQYPEIGVRSFGKGIFHKPTLIGANLDWQKLFRIHAGDLVVSNIKAWEGAIAVAGIADHERVGSHRYMTCVAREGLATPEFLCFYLLTPEGIGQVQAASPGSADRNRTLAMSRLEGIRVPVPPLQQQQAFSRLQAKVAAIQNTQTANQAELNALLPAVLDKAFKGEL